MLGCRVPFTPLHLQLINQLPTPGQKGGIPPYDQYGNTKLFLSTMTYRCVSISTCCEEHRLRDTYLPWDRSSNTQNELMIGVETSS